MLLRWAVIALLVSGFGVDRLTACSCAGSGPLCNTNFDELEPRESAVFVGRVVSAKPATIEEHLADTLYLLFPDLRGKKPRDAFMEAEDRMTPAKAQELRRLRIAAILARWGDRMTGEEHTELEGADADDVEVRFFMGARRVEIEVTEQFVGDLPARITISEGFGGGDCSVGFAEGESYLVNGRIQERGRVSTSICSGSNHVRFREDALRVLRARATGKPPTRSVSGFLLDFTDQGAGRDDLGVSGAVVSLRSGDRRLRATTDEKGEFRFDEIDPAIYTLEPSLPGYEVDELSPLDMRSALCRDVMIVVKQRQGRIRGRVVPQPGEEVPDYLWIEAVPADEYSVAPYDATARKEDGLFVIDELEPGRFYIAINVENAPTGSHGRVEGLDKIWPYATTYYPGTSDPAKAAVFEVQRGTVIDVGDWTLPARLKEVVIPGRLVLPDGSPASDVRLILRRPGRTENLSKFGPTDAEGRFEVYLLETIKYEIEALAQGDNAVYRGTLMLGARRPDELLIELAPSEPRASDAALFGIDRGR